MSWSLFFIFLLTFLFKILPFWTDAALSPDVPFRLSSSPNAMSRSQTLFFLLPSFLDPWYFWSEWQTWKMNVTTREKLVNTLKKAQAPLLYLLFPVPITLFPWPSRGYRPELSGVTLSANLGSCLWIGSPCGCLVSVRLLIGRLLRETSVSAWRRWTKVI